jgi:hypothetical protein
MISLERGHKSPIFSKNKRSLHPEHLSFSVYYQLTNQGEEKTLDVVCKDQIEYDNWVTGLMWLIENKEEITAAAQELEGPESTGRRGSLKIVDVENLRKEMNAHLDLCTWGNSAWGQLGHADKPDEIKDIAFPMVPSTLVFDALTRLSLRKSVCSSIETSMSSLLAVVRVILSQWQRLVNVMDGEMLTAGD